MRIGLVGAPFIIERHLLCDRHLHAFDRDQFVRGSEHASFGAGAVVTFNVDDEGVVELTQIIDGLNNPPDLMVRVGHVGSKHLSLVREQLLALFVERIPFREALWPFG